LNAFPPDNHGRGVRVGIIDSLAALPDHLSSRHESAEVYDHYVNENVNDTTGHGTDVTSLVSNTAQQVSLSLFRVIGSDPARGFRSRLIEAIVDAGGGNVDVLNLSVGKCRDCRGLCSICREAELVAEEDEVFIVAAAGNRPKSGERKGVACPAIPEAVLSVAGYRPLCGREIIRGDDSGQWWVENGHTYGPYCGQQGCCSDSECEQNRHETEWEGNVSFHNAAPDILAPVVEVHGNDLDKLVRQSGTSFGTPLVTGLAAIIFSDLRDRGVDLSPTDLRQAIRFQSTEIDDGDYCKMDAKNTVSYLLDTVS